MNRISLLLVASALVSSCSKKGDGGGGGGGVPASGGAAASSGAGDKPAATKLPKLGLTIEFIGDATVGDGMSETAVMITGGDVGAMQVELAKEPQAQAAAVEDAKMYTPLNEQSELIPPGGWLMTFENKGSAGTNYWVQAQRVINGKTYKCGSTVASAEQQKHVAWACKSLR